MRYRSTLLRASPLAGRAASLKLTPTSAVEQQPLCVGSGATDEGCPPAIARLGSESPQDSVAHSPFLRCFAGQTPSKLELNVLLKDHAMDDNIHFDTCVPRALFPTLP